MVTILKNKSVIFQLLYCKCTGLKTFGTPLISLAGTYASSDSWPSYCCIVRYCWSILVNFGVRHYASVWSVTVSFPLLQRIVYWSTAFCYNTGKFKLVHVHSLLGVIGDIVVWKCSHPVKHGMRAQKCFYMLMMLKSTKSSVKTITD